MSRTLFATAEPVLDAAVLRDSLPTQAVDVLTGAAALDAVLASGSKYRGAVIACGSEKASLDPSFLGGVAKLLQPGARATVQLAGGVAQVCVLCAAASAHVHACDARPTCNPWPGLRAEQSRALRPGAPGCNGARTPGNVCARHAPVQRGVHLTLSLNASQDEAKNALLFSGFVDCEATGASAVRAAWQGTAPGGLAVARLLDPPVCLLQSSPQTPGCCHWPLETCLLLGGLPAHTRPDPRSFRIAANVGRRQRALVGRRRQDGPPEARRVSRGRARRRGRARCRGRRGGDVEAFPG